MTVITCIEDLRLLAKRRVPKMFYEYADSGAWTESTYRANETDFAPIKLRQRVAVDIDNRSLVSTMVGQPQTYPFSHALAYVSASDGLTPACASIALFGARASPRMGSGTIRRSSSVSIFMGCSSGCFGSAQHFSLFSSRWLCSHSLRALS